MEGILKLFEKFFDLYVAVFQKEPLAAAITTLLFAGAFLLWTKAIKDGKARDPDEFWMKPGFVVCVGWLIVTPLLDIVLKVLGYGVDTILWVVKLYAETFRDSPLAAMIAILILLAIYGIFRLVAHWHWPWRRFRRAAELILIGLWLGVTPMVKMIVESKAHATAGSANGSDHANGPPTNAAGAK